MLIDDGPDVCVLGDHLRVLAHARSELVIINCLFYALDRAPGRRSTEPPTRSPTSCVAKQAPFRYMRVFVGPGGVALSSRKRSIY